MNENYTGQPEENLDTGSTAVKKTSIWSKIDNFWYHYKWHSLISLFLVFTITICTLQMCKKVDYDMHVLYASDRAIGRTSTSGDVSDFSKINQYLTRAASDTNKDGDVKVAFKDLYILNEKQLADENLSESNFQRTYNDRSALRNIMLSSEYYVCLFSKEIYEGYRDSDKQPLMKLNDKSIFGDADVPYLDDSKCGILLSDTEFAKKYPVDKVLSGDIVLCLRRVPVAQISKSDYKTSISFLKSLVSTTVSK